MSDILQAFLNAPVLPFDAAAGAALDGLRVRHVRIAAMDLRIAAIALSRNLVLLTRNERDFSRVPGLRTEDWTAKSQHVAARRKAGLVAVSNHGRRAFPGIRWAGTRSIHNGSPGTRPTGIGMCRIAGTSEGPIRLG